MKEPNKPTPGPERVKALKAFFGTQLGDYLARDAQQAREAEPGSLVQPIYIGKLVEPYYRDLIAILDSYGEHSALKAELAAARPVLKECLDQFTAFFDEAWKTVGNGDARRPWNQIEKKLRAALAYREKG